MEILGAADRVPLLKHGFLPGAFQNFYYNRGMDDIKRKHTSGFIRMRHSLRKIQYINDPGRTCEQKVYLIQSILAPRKE